MEINLFYYIVLCLCIRMTSTVNVSFNIIGVYYIFTIMQISKVRHNPCILDIQ